MQDRGTRIEVKRKRRKVQGARFEEQRQGARIEVERKRTRYKVQGIRNKERHKGQGARFEDKDKLQMGNGGHRNSWTSNSLLHILMIGCYNVYKRGSLCV